jgi:hypothetical protein
MFHLSENKNILSIKPTVPKDISEEIEDNKIKRVCFAPSINQAIIALLPSSNSKKSKNWHITLYVYRLVDTNNIRLMTNDEIISKQLVYDAHITGETWALDECKVLMIGKIKLFPNIEISTTSYEPLRGNRTGHEARLVKFEWDREIIIKL